MLLRSSSLREASRISNIRCSFRHLKCHVGDGERVFKCGFVILVGFFLQLQSFVGVNDAPALAAADIGVAMGVGAALAMETADVTLLDSNLKKLLYSVNMGRKVIWTIKQNVAFSLIVKFLVLGFTVAGKVALWAAIVSDVGAMICVTLNGMRLLPSRKIDRKELGDIENVTYHSQVSEGTDHERGAMGIVGIKKVDDQHHRGSHDHDESHNQSHGQSHSEGHSQLPAHEAAQNHGHSHGHS